MRIHIIAFTVIIIYSSCSSNEFDKSKYIKKEYYTAIKEYVMEKKEYDQFLLIPADKFITERDDVNGYLIGPFYPLMLELLELDALELVRFPSGKTVFYTTDFTGLFEPTNNYLKNIKDSVFDYKSRAGDNYTRNPLINFLKRSRLMILDNKMSINRQPDTLFLPKNVGVDYFIAPQTNSDDKRNHILTDYTEIPDL